MKDLRQTLSMPHMRWFRSDVPDQLKAFDKEIRLL